MTVLAPKNGMRPIHPGEILREDYVKPLGLSANALAHALHVPASRINDILLQRRGITVDTAMRLVRYFGGDVRSWMNLQIAYDIRVAEKTISKRLEREVQPRRGESILKLAGSLKAPKGKRVAIEDMNAWR